MVNLNAVRSKYATERSSNSWERKKKSGLRVVWDETKILAVQHRNTDFITGMQVRCSSNSTNQLIQLIHGMQFHSKSELGVGWRIGLTSPTASDDFRRCAVVGAPNSAKGFQAPVYIDSSFERG